MSRKATLDALFGAKAAPEMKSGDPDLGINALGAPNDVEPAPLASPPSARVRSGAIGAMGASLQQLKDSAAEAELLREAVAAGERVLELDPALIDAAPVADRFAEGDDAAIAGLIDSIRTSGQQVPVLVRPHPALPGRWQAAYGHRRIRACRALGLPVKAIVKALSDGELAIAQGKENLERRDLSFIEKAFFAAGLEEAGFDRATVSQALGADRADVSRYLSLVRAVPGPLVRLIGPAPKTGRARWQELIEALANRPAKAQPLGDLMELLPQLNAFQRTDSDGRFRMVLARLMQVQPVAKPESNALVQDSLVQDSRGQPIARLRVQGKRHQFEVDEQLAPGFAAYVAGALPDLYQRWHASRAGTTGSKPE